MSTPVLHWRWGDGVAALTALLARGGVLAIPTESSYGLAADPTSARGVAAVFAIKGRPADKPLPVVVAGEEVLVRLGVATGHPAYPVLAAAWPAPLTLVLPLAGEARPSPLPAAAGAPNLAVRVPAHDGLRRLLREVGGALTATSANPAGAPPLLDSVAAAELLAGHDAAVVDDGNLPGGPPSTLLALDPGAPVQLLRGGAFPVDEVERRLAAAGLVLDDATGGGAST